MTNSCSFCRFLRILVIGGAGGLAGVLGAQWMAADQSAQLTAGAVMALVALGMARRWLR